MSPKKFTAQSLKVRGDQQGEQLKRRAFLLLCQQRGIPVPETEYVFASPRRWRFDFAWPDKRVALEVEGGIWTRGAHVRGQHVLSDMEKYNSAAALGWFVFRTTPKALCTADTLAWIDTAFKTTVVLR